MKKSFPLPTVASAVLMGFTCCALSAPIAIADCCAHAAICLAALLITSCVAWICGGLQASK
jgi:hypothetical protein